MKRILVMGMSKDRGGMETCIMNYYRHIDKSKFQFDFITYNALPYCAKEIETLGGRCFVVTGRSVNYKKNKEELRNIFMQYGSEYAALWYNCCIISDMTIFKLATEFNIPRRIVHSHNSRAMGNFVTNFLHRLNKSKIEKYATDFWACSVSAADFFYSNSIINSDKFRVITNAIKTDEYKFDQLTRAKVREELSLGNDFVIGNAGRMTDQKNQMFLLDIFAALNKMCPSSTLVIAGQGEMEQLLKEKVKKMNLDEKVRFLGQRSDVAGLYSAMDTFILPSKYEGLPMTLVEAQAAGLPCFTTSEAVTPEAQITPLLQFMSLNDSAVAWADAIYSRYKKDVTGDRLAWAGKMKESPWNIRRAAVRLEELFLQRI